MQHNNDTNDAVQQKMQTLRNLLATGKKNGKLSLKEISDALSVLQLDSEEVDKIYVELKKYESEIKQSNRNLNTMFDANVNYYHELVKYILAGEQGCRELEAYIAQRQADMQSTGDNSIQFEITSLNQALMMLEQRTQDLRTAESVAMQSIPMIKAMEFSNMNLVRKINSAFIITLPVFKQALAQAIMLKRQKIQAEAMSAHDRAFAAQLVHGTRANVEAIDAQIAANSREWKVERMAAVDRNLTRMATYEMCFAEEKLTPNIAINEAVELAKKYGTDDSSRYVNGILGAIMKSAKSAE